MMMIIKIKIIKIKVMIIIQIEIIIVQVNEIKQTKFPPETKHVQTHRMHTNTHTHTHTHTNKLFIKCQNCVRKYASKTVLV